MATWNNANTYGSVAKFFHWVLVVLVLLMLLLGFFMGDIDSKVLKGVAYNAHKLLGVIILTLMLLRTLWALTNIKPSSLPSAKTWERWTERAVHFLLYALLLAMPLSGWIGSSSAGKPPILGRWHLALPLAPNKNLINFSFTVHEYIAWTLIALISVHILAALYHYFFKKDAILQRMWG